jgi:hypothetical protein
MITRSDIEALVERSAVPESPVLSVYLGTDQSKASNLNRHFEATLRDALRSIGTELDEKQLETFSADAEPVQGYFSGLQPRGKGAIVFSDASENFFWAREINASVRNNARWSDTPYVVPLIEILDEYERTGVVLVDKAHARLFTVFMGEIEEHENLLAPLSVSRIKSTGTDQILSENRFQKKAETHVHSHLKHVAETLDKYIDRYGFDRLLLGGTVEATSELQQLLSKRAGELVAGRLSLRVMAAACQVLE